MRVLMVIIFIILHLIGCGKHGLKLPPNADPIEKSSLLILLPKTEHAWWNKKGRIEDLSLIGWYVNDADLIHVVKLTDLCELGLMGTSITDDGLMELKNNQKLRALSLQYSQQFTDSGLKVLKCLPNITTLDLVHTNITDKSVEVLIQTNNLSHLFLKGTKITQEGITQLKAKLPKTHIQTE